MAGSNGCVVYYRVSTARQGASGLGIAAQREAVSRYLAATGLDALSEFTEVESGKKRSRAELDKAIASAKAYRVPLVVAKIDRLSRNATFLGTLRESGVRFVAADMPEANDMTVGILALVAEHEGKAISQRTKEALAAAKARGTELGGWRGGPKPTDEMRAMAAQSKREAARTRARELAPVMQELQEAGIRGLRETARELSRRGVPTPTGKREWSPVQVRRLLDSMPEEIN